MLESRVSGAFRRAMVEEWDVKRGSGRVKEVFMRK